MGYKGRGVGVKIKSCDIPGMIADGRHVHGQNICGPAMIIEENEEIFTGSFAGNPRSSGQGLPAWPETEKPNRLQRILIVSSPETGL